MEALGVNTWLVPSELALSEAFLTILAYEYRGIKLKVEMELRPLHHNNLYCILMKWQSPSIMKLFHFIKRERNDFCIKRITVSIV